MEFFEALSRYAFLQHALIAGVLAGVACGVVGSYVVVRRITSIAGAIAHCVLGGLGVARWLQVVHGQEWASPMLGAVAAAMAAALVIGLVSLRTREREDTLIGALWAVGMAVGILFISRTPGYDQDLMSYLFGNILLVRSTDLWLLAALDAAVVALAVLLFPQLQAVCFDEEFASVVGIVLVIALLTLPVAIAGRCTSTLRGMMVLSAILSIAFTVAGLALSYAPDLPAGATTIVLVPSTSRRRFLAFRFSLAAAAV